MVMFVLGCNPTKYVPANEHLLYTSKIKVIDNTVKPDALKSYVKQKPNKKIFGWIRFHLGLYNLSNIKKEKGIHKFLRKIGEEPVIFDPNLTDKSIAQLDIYMKNKGYYNAQITDTVYFKGKKAHLTYNIEGGRPYRIRNIEYSIRDSNISRIYFNDSVNSLLKKGDLFDKDVVLQNERSRIERLLKINGYYNFTREYVYFEVDSALSTRQVDINIQILNPTNLVNNTELSHQQYKVRKIIISGIPDLAEVNTSLSTSDTLDVGRSIFITDIKKLRINPRSFTQFLYIQPGKLYNETSMEETYNHVSSLNLFKMVDIKFSEIPSADTSDYSWLDCNIRLSPSLLQSYSTDLEGTNSSGNIGGAINFNYQHINLFGNAEVLDVKFRGALESLKERKTAKISRTEEFGVETNLKFPKFLIPFRTENFIKKYNPKTILSLSYNYQSRPEFTRTVLNAGFGYNWKETKHKEHIYKPLEINYVDIKDPSSEFDSIISGTYLESSYRDHLITNMSYSYIYNNQKIKKNQDFMFFRFNAESAGNIMSLFNSNLKKVVDSTLTYHTFLDIQYSQYIKSDVEYKFYKIINPASNIVYRLFAGAAYPYGNSKATPFEKRYFSGGANGLRGWQVRSVGPGTAIEDSTKYPNSTGDIKLEANFEYRFKLFWKIEGAFFVDAGNIWAIREEDNRRGASFKWDQFYKEFAVDSGLGLRFDFSFFLFRTDVGMKMRDPSLPSGGRWILGSRKLKGDDFAFQIGIGYPF